MKHTHHIFITGILFLLIFVFAQQTWAQDEHFSQMRFTPLAVNPSSAGLNGKYNAAAIYRSQWQSVADPYTTVGASFDLKFGRPRSKSFFAAGINFYYDIAGDMKMTTSSFDLSLAYHVGVGENSTLGLGVQTGYGSRGVGNTEGLYASQYDGTQLNPTILSGENFGHKNFGHLNLGAGIVFSHDGLRNGIFSSHNYNLRVGVAAYHLTKPKYTFLANGDDALAMRFSGFVESEFAVRHSNFSFMPALYYQYQNGLQDVLMGTYIKYSITPSSVATSLVKGFSIAYGPFYRFGDAFVNKLLIDYNGYALGFAYDVNISPLTRASKGRGGFEIMFHWHLTDVHKSRARIR